MFNLFFIKYKNEIYKSGFKMIDPEEWIMLGIALLSSFYISFVAIFNVKKIPFLIALIILISDIIICHKYESNKDSKEIDQRISEYHSGNIEKLIKLLKDNMYNLYTIEGVDWLITSCERHLKEKSNVPGIVASSLITSVIAIAQTIVLRQLDINTIILYIVGAIILMLIFQIANKYVFKQIIEVVDNPYKGIYSSLKSDLEYIKIQLIGEQNLHR